MVASKAMNCERDCFLEKPNANINMYLFNLFIAVDAEGFGNSFNL